MEYPGLDQFTILTFAGTDLSPIQPHWYVTDPSLDDQ